MNKILLIEDDEFMVRMYQRVFSLEGYDVQIAVDGLEGLEKAKSFQPDIILLDVMMPNLNGLQTLEKLKQDPQTKGYPVIMLTNLVNKQDAEYSLKIGAIKYLIKSDYNPKEVLEIVRQCLNERAPQDNPAITN